MIVDPAVTQPVKGRTIKGRERKRLPNDMKNLDPYLTSPIEKRPRGEEGVTGDEVPREAIG